MLVVACIVTACWTHNAFAQTVDLSSPDGKIKVALLKDNGTVSYSVTLNGNEIIRQSALGLKGDAESPLKISEVTQSSVDKQWESVWGNQKINHDRYNEVQLKVEKPSEQTIIVRAYDDGIAFRYAIPDGSAK